jgi:hypothetical protein
MNAAVERKIIRWFHIIASIPVVGYIYGPVADIPQAAWMVKMLLFPLVALSGLWMWKGHVVKRWVKRS